MNMRAFVPSTSFLARPRTAAKRARVCAVQVRNRTAKLAMTTETGAMQTVIKTGDAINTERLESFADRTKGEWAGFEGAFSSDTGEPQTIPDFYIPEDFVQWNQYPKGFETNYSTIVRGNKLYRKFFRVLPAVALFADHVDLESSFTVSDFDELPGFHFFSDGSYSAGPTPVSTKRDSILDKWPAVDFCIRDPREPRSWAIHVEFDFDFAKAEFVDDVRVIREKYSCIYCDGADIEGSSGFVEGWVSDAKMEAEALKGDWNLPDGSIVSRPEGGLAHEPKKHVYLPFGIDVGIDEADNGGRRAWVAWLVDADTRVIMSRMFAADGSVTLSNTTIEKRST